MADRHAAHAAHYREVCALHGTTLAQCRCPSRDKEEHRVPCPGPPRCVAPDDDKGRPGPATHDARNAQDSLAALLVPWRVGGSIGRTIYAVFGPDDDVVIGMMDTAQLAREAAFRHNDALKEGR